MQTYYMKYILYAKYIYHMTYFMVSYEHMMLISIHNSIQQYMTYLMQCLYTSQPNADH